MIIKLDDRQIELPNSLKNISEITVTYKDYGNPLYAIVQYKCQKNMPYKILEYSIFGKELISGKDKRVWEWYPSMNFSLIKDGFISNVMTERLELLQVIIDWNDLTSAIWAKLIQETLSPGRNYRSMKEKNNGN